MQQNIQSIQIIHQLTTQLGDALKDIAKICENILLTKSNKSSITEKVSLRKSIQPRQQAKPDKLVIRCTKDTKETIETKEKSLKNNKYSQNTQMSQHSIYSQEQLSESICNMVRNSSFSDYQRSCIQLEAKRDTKKQTKRLKQVQKQVQSSLTRKKPANKKPNHPPYPKRPSGPYYLYQSQMRQVFCYKNPGLSFSSQTKKQISLQWKRMSQTQKMTYKQQYRVLKDNYEEEIQKYRRENPGVHMGKTNLRQKDNHSHRYIAKHKPGTKISQSIDLENSAERRHSIDFLEDFF